MPTNFALIGAGGYIAPRHLEAIKQTGNHLVAATDPHDSVGVLDSYFPNAKFFSEIERFDRFLDKLRRSKDPETVKYISICSPNYLHDAHVRLAFRLQANAICEKPLVLSPWNLDALAELEKETGKRVFNILQLRLSPMMSQLKKELEQAHSKNLDVELTYITRRGPWYHTSWKGQSAKSGGIVMNIGIHLFDMLLHIFGKAGETQLHFQNDSKAAGHIQFARANVRWFLSIDPNDVPSAEKLQGKHAYRCMSLGEKRIEFSEGFTGLHTKSYEEILAGRGYGIEDVRPAIELAYTIRHLPVSKEKLSTPHSFLKSVKVAA